MTSKQLLRAALLTGLITLLLAGRSYAGPPEEGVPVSVTGELIVLYLDDFENKRAELQYFIEEKQSKKRFRLQFEGTPPGHLRSGATVKVRGKAKGKQIYLAATVDDSTGPAIETISYAVAPKVSGEQRTVVLVSDFQDAQISCSVDEIRDLMFTDPNNQSVDDYYREISQDQLWLNGEVHGKYTIDFSGDCSTPFNAYTDPINAAAAADGVDLSQFDRRVYVLPYTGCGYAGVAVVGTTPSDALIFTCGVQDVYAHELGHNLGMSHAATPGSEYGDTTDVMGLGGVGLRHLNSAHQNEMGWRAPAMNTLISESGTFDIAPQSLYESQALAPQILRIAIPGTDEYYYIAYRRPLGFDSQLQTYYHNTVTVHRYQGAGGPPTKTYLLDYLSVGESFTDTTNNITISYISQTPEYAPEYATVQIQLDGSEPPPPTCTPSAPVVSLSPSNQSADAGATLTYTASVTNTDDSNCAESTFALTGSLPADWTATLSPSTLSLAPGATGTAALAVTSPSNAAATTHGVGVSVSDSSEAVHAASGSASYTVVEACAVATPSLSLSPSSQNGDAGATLGYTIALVNNDSAACSASTFDLSIIALPGGWDGSLSTASLSLTPGATGTANLSVTSALTATGGNYSVQLGAADAQEALHAKAASATYVVNDTTPTGDTEAPTAPAELAASSNTKQVNLSWLASSDNVGVAAYQVYRDGVMIASTPDTGYTDRDGASGVVYAYSVAATDAAANVSPASNEVTAGKAKAKAKGKGSGGDKGKGHNK
jgi:hypothetical protein